MTPPYTLTQLTDVEDSAVKFGLGDIQEARFCGGDLEAQDTGLSLYMLKPDKRQPFGHKHDEAEEVYVVVAGSGRMKLDDEIVDIEKLDAVRVAPGVMRSFEAGSDGLQMLAFGPHHEGDGELVQGWWAD
jgi:mannose-6-phosphate isomerase-like protein (cupin superfamily)